MTRLLVVSHPAVLPVNQLPYAELARRGWEVHLITPDRWSNDYAADGFAARALPELAERHEPRRVAFGGQAQRHLYLADPWTALRRIRPEVVFCEQEPFSVAAAQWGLAARSRGIPFGVQFDRLPLGPSYVLELILAARAKAAAV